MSRTIVGYLSCLAMFGCATQGELTLESDASVEAEEVAPELAAEQVINVDGTYENGKHILGVAADDGRNSSQGPLASGMASTHRVWEVTREWTDEDNAAGMAWPANSGLNWEEKYSAWVDSLVKTEAENGHDTVEIVTPWGRELPGPRLECSEMGMFMRALFASWYNLPFYMTATGGSGTVHYGHFGIVDNNGVRVSGTSNYRSAYTDYTSSMSGQSNSQILANWPDDTVLEGKSLVNAHEDAVEFLGANAYFGAYVDEMVLNKRAGYFLIKLLEDFGSIHFASDRNLWNIEAEAIRPGDIMLHRWQPSGIGHVMVIKEVNELPGGNIDVAITYGSMPRIQPVWYDTAIAKSYFTSDYAGSAEMGPTNVAYSHYGGGAKRWRTAKLSGSYWTNTVTSDDLDVWISPTDYATLEARVATFEEIIGEMTPEETRDALLEQIEMARTNLEGKPASCSNRERREQAFEDLYEVMETEFGWSRQKTDETYRIIDDYVFEELEYTQSKTCCWNSTTPAMYDIIMDYNKQLVEDAHDNDECAAPVVFMGRDGGTYAPFTAYAASVGRSAEWLAWTADESCPQAGVANDTIKSEPFSDFCDVAEDVMDWSECPNGGVMHTYYADSDNDGYGGSSSVEACSAPAGYVSNDDDCNNNNASVRPGVAELCDSVDNDCDGTVDEGCGGNDTGDNGTDTGDNGGNDTGGYTPGGGCSCSDPVDAPGMPLLGAGVGLMALARRRRLL